MIKKVLGFDILILILFSPHRGSSKFRIWDLGFLFKLFQRICQIFNHVIKIRIHQKFTGDIIQSP